jgi:crossover junction endodeoxyribonuclease RuvC
VIYVGIDPGNSGAIAVIDNGVVDMYPLHTETLRSDAQDAFEDIKQYTDEQKLPVVVCMEKVGSMPRQGVASTFKFGVAYGILQGMCIAYGFGIQYEPTPQQWKKVVFTNTHKGLGREEQKQMAREQARKLYPALSDKLKLKKDADKAEAVLLAHFAMLAERREAA